jgi:glucan phosphorylase
MIAEPEYQTYIPEQWRELHRREEAATQKVEAERLLTREHRAATLRHALQVTLRALVTAAKVIGVAALALLGLLMAMVAVLGAVNSSPARRRRRRR